MNEEDPKPEVTTPELKPETKAIELKPEPKETGAKPETKAPEPKPEAKATEIKPQAHAAKSKLDARNTIIFTLSILGILGGIVAAYLFGAERKAQPPLFKPVSSPYQSAIYANGIIESDQASGANINIYPDVSGPITKISVSEGQHVSVGDLLFVIDNSVQSANVELAESNLKMAHDQYDKRLAAYTIDHRSISKDVLDNAKDAYNQAAASLKAATALLRKYSVKAQIEGIVLTVNTTTGGYVSSQGAYNAFTQGFDPLVVMSALQDYLGVRCYIDEILVSRLPSPKQISAQMSVQGTDIKIPLEFVRVQPYVSPKIELSNQRQEQVDLRVLPVIFRFKKNDAPVYPGQLVDVYIGQGQTSKGDAP
jgi:HlyD family secretion protein